MESNALYLSSKINKCTSLSEFFELISLEEEAFNDQGHTFDFIEVNHNYIILLEESCIKITYKRSNGIDTFTTTIDDL